MHLLPGFVPPAAHEGAAPAHGRAMAARDHGRPARQSHSWPAVFVLDTDVTMRFWTARLLGFELLLPPTRFSTRLVSSSQLVAFVHFVRGPGIFILNHLAGFIAKAGLFMFCSRGADIVSVAFGAHDEPNYSAGLVPSAELSATPRPEDQYHSCGVERDEVLSRRDRRRPQESHQQRNLKVIERRSCLLSSLVGIRFGAVCRVGGAGRPLA